MQNLAQVWMALEGDALPKGAEVTQVHGREAINALPQWQVELLATQGPLVVDGLVGTPVTLVLQDAPDQVSRTLALIVTSVTYLSDTSDGLLYQLQLSPPEWLLTLRSGFRIFLDKTGPDILRQVLQGAGMASDTISFRLSGAYGLRPHTTQYDEGDWAFFHRICAEEGISYWFDTVDAGPLLVLGDDMASHDGLEGGSAIPFEDPSARVRPRACFALEVSEEVVHDAVHLRDYDVRHPDVPIEGEAGSGPWLYDEVPARVLDEAQAAERALVRLQQLQRFRVQAMAKTDTTRLRPGRLVTLVGTANGELDADYLVVGVDHHWARPTRGTGDTSGYHNEAVLVPKQGPPHRPALPLRRPRLNGAETAIVTGPSGQEIHVNDLGDLKIRFPWDRSGITDDRSSTWVRTLQMGLGGSLLIPRVGWEVPVVYYDGDPDRPLVLGRTYNAEGVVPYNLPGAKASTTLQSATSPGGGSTNELRMNDAGGGMELFIHGSRDQSVAVGGSSTTTVSTDATHDVGQSLTLGVKSSQTLTVGGDQTIDVVTDDSLGVKGARAETVGAVEINKVTANRVVSVKGAYSELVGALYGIQANQVNIDVTGTFNQMVGATIAHGAGLGTSESVGGIRSEMVGGVRSITAAKAYGESVYGAKTVTAGACRVKAGTLATTSTKGAQTTQVGGSITINASGKAVFSANQIQIQAASLDAGALNLAGGSFKVKKGAAKLDGTVKRRGGSKIG